MFYFKQIIPLIFLSLFYYSCSPLKSSPNEEKHQMELTIHEMQTGIDDLRHNYNCYETELKILDGKIKNHENSVSEIKNIFVDSHKHKIEKALSTLSLLEKKLHFLEKKLTALEKDLELLNYHANESSTAFKQHKEKITELESQIFTQNKKFEEIIRLKSLIQTIAQTVGNYKIYKVQRGDSLEKIAKEFKINIQQLKKLNQLEDDLIVIGKELKIPNQ